VHGGFVGTVLDSVTGCAIHSMLDPGVGYGTIDLGLKLVRAVPLDRELIAEGRVLHLSRTLGVSEGSVKDADGTLYAHATCTCAILPKRPGGP
jgi:uncharacterized protein (TIGR00369 family)